MHEGHGRVQGVRHTTARVNCEYVSSDGMCIWDKMCVWERSFWRSLESSLFTTVLSTGYEMHSATTECMHNRDQISKECGDYAMHKLVHWHRDHASMECDHYVLQYTCFFIAVVVIHHCMTFVSCYLQHVGDCIVPDTRWSATIPYCNDRAGSL